MAANTLSPPFPGADGVADGDPDVDMIGSDQNTQEKHLETSAVSGEESEERIKALMKQLDTHPPARKDVSLREFLSKMDDYAPIIPDAVTAHALTLAGLPPPPLSATSAPNAPQDPTTTPLHLSRLLALATQKFIADIAADAYQYSRMRSGNLTSNTLSALSNPGATAAPGSFGPVPGAVGAQAGVGGPAGDKGGKVAAGQHVLGMQRAGFGGGGQGGGQGRTVLTMEDLGMAVGEYGVNVKRGEFYR